MLREEGGPGDPMSNDPMSLTSPGGSGEVFWRRSLNLSLEE